MGSSSSVPRTREFALLSHPNCPPLGHSRLKENEIQASSQGCDSWGCISPISVSPEGAGMVYLFNINSFGTELCALSAMWVTKVSAFLHHSPLKLSTILSSHGT